MTGGMLLELGGGESKEHREFILKKDSGTNIPPVSFSS